MASKLLPEFAVYRTPAAVPAALGRPPFDQFVALLDSFRNRDGLVGDPFAGDADGILNLLAERSLVSNKAHTATAPHPLPLSTFVELGYDGAAVMR